MIKDQLLFLVLIFGVIATPASAAEKELDILGIYIPSGWMGDIEDIDYVKNWTDTSRPDETCIRIDYSATGSRGEGWSGIYWQNPANNWGNNSKYTADVEGSKIVTFWARGENGGEKAEFKVGGITGQYPDSIETPISTGVVELSNSWTQYTIDLAGQDLSHVIGGFCWVTNRALNPHGCTIYLDEIKYEW